MTETVDVFGSKKESKAVEFVFLVLAVVFFLLCIWASQIGNMAAVPFGVLTLVCERISLSKKLSQ